MEKRLFKLKRNKCLVRLELEVKWRKNERKKSNRIKAICDAQVRRMESDSGTWRAKEMQMNSTVYWKRAQARPCLNWPESKDNSDKVFNFASSTRCRRCARCVWLWCWYRSWDTLWIVNANIRSCHWHDTTPYFRRHRSTHSNISHADFLFGSCQATLFFLRSSIFHLWVLRIIILVHLNSHLYWVAFRVLLHSFLRLLATCLNFYRKFLVFCSLFFDGFFCVPSFRFFILFELSSAVFVTRVASMRKRTAIELNWWRE